MKSTGERFIPAQTGVTALEHFHRYFYSLAFIKDLHVLDIACGEGYGSAILSTKASSVVGVDIDQSSITHAKKQYGSIKNLDFKLGSLTKIPLNDNCVDVITCFESIEHIIEHELAVKEFKRVLKPGGLLLLSTPNKYVYSDISGHKNPFHPKELYREELDKLLSDNFNWYRTTGQRVALTSLLLGDEINQNPLEWIRSKRFPTQTFPETSTYFFSFASDGKIPDFNSSIYEGDISLVEFLAQQRNVITNRDALRFLIKNIGFLNALVEPFYRLFKRILK